MQPNTIALSVDTENDGVGLETQTYTRYEEQLNRSTYVGPEHSLDSRQTLQLYRTPPTKNGNFRGTAKSAVKFTQDVEVPGVDSSTTQVAPIIMEISFSIPVGASAETVLEVRQRGLALVDTDSVMTALNMQLMI